ncbi:MAG: hypothetical protein Q8L36_01340 [bacterium]|nr:hypothetical protein [bacterium]
MDKINKLSLPVVILIASIILGGFFYASQLSKQKSIEKQRQIELQAKTEADQAKAEQDRKEYVVKRTKDCYDYETSERKKFNNVDGSRYLEEKDICIVRYKTDEYKGVDCTKVKGIIDTPSLFATCLTGIFTNEF